MRPRASVAAALLLAVAAALAAGSCGGGPARPNIVLLVWDTCRADRLSLNGHDRPTTPWLEKFAAGAVRYTRCYAPAPFTAPSHGSLFTGVSPHRHGLEAGLGDRIRGEFPLLAETLEGAGYESLAFTANAYISELTGLSRGFREVVPVWREPVGENTADKVLAAVSAWLDRRKPRPGEDGPFFLFLNFMDCHQPLNPPKGAVAAVRLPGDASDELHRASLVDQQAALAHLLGLRKLDEGTLRGLRVRYDAAIRFLDGKTGEVLDLLEGKGLLRDSLVAVLSDHGENLGEHGLLDHRLSLHDTLLHVPLVVRRAGRYEGGRTVDRQVSLMDLYPVILDAAGLPVPRGNGVDAVPLPPEGRGGGRPLLAELARPLSQLEEARKAFPEAPENLFAPLFLAVSSARDPWDSPRPRKLLRYTRAKQGGGEEVVREELFDFVADPLEERNLLEGADPAARADADRLAAGIRRLRGEAP